MILIDDRARALGSSLKNQRENIARCINAVIPLLHHFKLGSLHEAPAGPSSISKLEFLDHLIALALHQQVNAFGGQGKVHQTSPFVLEGVPAHPGPLTARSTRYHYAVVGPNGHAYKTDWRLPEDSFTRMEASEQILWGGKLPRRLTKLTDMASSAPRAVFRNRGEIPGRPPCRVTPDDLTGFSWPAGESIELASHTSKTEQTCCCGPLKPCIFTHQESSLKA